MIYRFDLPPLFDNQFAPTSVEEIMAPSAPEPPKRAAEDPTVQREHKRPRAVATSQARGLTPVEDRIVASVLWTNPRSTVEGNHDLFKSLPCTKTFEDLREHLQGHTRTFDLFDNALIQTNLRRLLIDQVIVMAMNDYTCKTGKAGTLVLDNPFSDTH